jgi:carnitine 3-dehydrogenase
LVDLVATQSDAQSGAYGIRALERIRDPNLIGFLRALKERNWGAGKVLLAHDAARAAAFHSSDDTPKGAPLVMAQMQVLPGWIDYNGHMTESRYYFANSETVDAFLRLIGAGMDYVGAGHSYYSAETHIRHLGEAKLGDRLTGTVQILSADEKRFRSFVRIMKGEECVATVEQLCLHVNMAEGKSAPASAEVWAKLKAIADAHAGLPLPEGAGRAVVSGAMPAGVVPQPGRQFVAVAQAIRAGREVDAALHRQPMVKVLLNPRGEIGVGWVGEQTRPADVTRRPVEVER